MTIKQFIKNLFKKTEKIQWEYGTCNGALARRHKGTNRVQFVLWEAGEQGNAEDFWVNVGRGHEINFIPDEEKNTQNEQ